MPTEVKFEVKDERTIQVPVPASNVDTETLGKFILNAGQDGYSLKSVGTIQRGDQRDPYTTGLRVTVAK